MDASGDFVVAWHGFAQDGSDYGVFARRFNAMGVAQGVEFQVNVYTPLDQNDPAVGMESDGDFAVAWDSEGQDGSDVGVFARLFTAAGVGGPEFQINVYISGTQRRPVVARNGGGFVVAWESSGQDGELTGVFARRFAALSIVDVDGNGVFDPLTDGVLVLRFLFGFTGPSLVAGAVDLAGCTRCDAPAIQAYLQTLL
jgi:hypothetical protein